MSDLTSDASTIDEDAQQLSFVLANLARRAHGTLLAAARRIIPGDEECLQDSEIGNYQDAVLSVRRARGAARLAARRLLVELNAHQIIVPTTRSGAPHWPDGFVGSLSHDKDFAVAIVGRSNPIVGVGVDIEPAVPLPAELLSVVATPIECKQLEGADLIQFRLLHCIKEAVFKCTNPLDGVFLTHHDIEVCLMSSRAQTSSGHTVRVLASAHPRLLAIGVL